MQEELEGEFRDRRLRVIVIVIAIAYSGTIRVDDRYRHIGTYITKERMKGEAGEEVKGSAKVNRRSEGEAAYLIEKTKDKRKTK